ncbi:ABC transporter permease [Companilactobacillus mishanensis]|uniref:ABC transporter permease n=1 Tax=Companilactobacillus mishanensis TaxID=2486008 RepID=A0A5P0ZK67_9LACO|nr:ABC transporter permease [Companilactobacillus mishanensis]MQS53506.1 ABC transporter permease [Companilactobacillus mishanensis]
MNLSIRKINAIFKLKTQSIFTNMSIMVAPLMAIGYVLIMKLVMPDTGFTGAYLLGFGVLFNVILGGIMMGSYPLSEEKEKNTLRVLMTSSVNGMEFLIGSLLPSIILIVVVNIILVPISSISISKISWGPYLLFTTLGGLISLLLGYVIGIYSKSQMQSSNISMPFIVLLTFTPVFQAANKSLAHIMSYTYSGVITEFISKMLTSGIYNFDVKNIVVMVSWFIICLVVFVYAYSKHGLDYE